MTESHLHARFVQLSELGRRVVAVEGDVLMGRAEVLTKREDIHVYLTQIAHYCDDFLDCLSHPENHPCLRRYFRSDALGETENLQHSRVAAARSRFLVEAGYCLRV